MKTIRVKVADIITTEGTQVRAKIDADVVEQYAEDIKSQPSAFPPVVVFKKGSDLILADGFHRLMAYGHLGETEVDAVVRIGGRADALRFALSANACHGMRRTNADKRRSVGLALDEWPKLSDREIARICAVGNDLVGAVRREGQLSENDSSHKCKGCGVEIDSRAAHFTGKCRDCHLASPETRIGADGKERKLPTRARPEPEAEPEETWQEPDVDSPAPSNPKPESFAPYFAVQFEEWLNSALESRPTPAQLCSLIASLEVGLRRCREAKKATT